MSNLYDWCMNSFGDESSCSNLKDTSSQNANIELSNILSEELSSKSDADIQREINTKRRYIIDIKRYLENENYFTNQTLSEDNKSEINKKFFEMLGFIGLIVMHILLIVIIFINLSNFINK
tara:strand:+ start:215 stop:577 length:363 start_codon:yes stop_codon:yes gene_type:complete